MRQTKFWTQPALLSIVALFTTSLPACSEEIDDGEIASDEEAPEHVHSHALTQPQWTFCSNQNQRCNFSGTKKVRFGANGRFTTRSFTNGTNCSNRTFGVRYGSGNTCEVLLDVEVDAGSSGGTGGTADAGHDHPPTVDAGTVDSGHDMPMVDAGTSGGGMTGGGMTGMGPYIDNSKIPTGSPGVSKVEISTTSERPTPYDIGAFRTSCEFSHMNYDDAIVYPGQPGKAHLHAYFGNTGANYTSTAESLRSSGNSTCRGGIANRSSYWVPALIGPNGAPIKPHSAQIYYKTGYEGVRPDQIKQFPQGLRVIAGDAKTTAPGQERAYWSCETYNGHPNAIPDCAAGEKVIMMVEFPQCWNGKDLDSPDHKSHMSYPMDSGGCPSTHPVAIPELTYNIYYSVPAGQRSSTWRLSSDMYEASKPGGYSAHADWIEGWDPQVSAAFVKNCDQASMDCKSHLLGDGRMIYNSLEPDE